MPATRKITKEAQNQDLEQLKGLFNVAKSQGISEQKIETVQASDQVKTSEKIETVAKSEQKNENLQKSAEKSSQVSQNSEKSTSDTTVGIRMTTQKKREIKAFFIQKGTTLSQGILDAYNLLKALDSEGSITYKDGQLIRN